MANSSHGESSDSSTEDRQEDYDEAVEKRIWLTRGLNLSQ